MTYPSAPFGPWIGVPRERQHICAIAGCEAEGMPHRCPADGNLHYHGAVHYDTAGQELYEKHRVKLRHGWGLLCDEHYAIVKEILEKR